MLTSVEIQFIERWINTVENKTKDVNFETTIIWQ